MNIEKKIIWAPQPGPQTAYVECPFQEIFLGGARGGGKTDAVLGKWVILAMQYGQAFNAVMFRRTTISADDAIERSKQIYTPMGGFYREQYKSWIFPNNARIRFRYLEKISDAEHYQGQNLSHAWVEEVGQYPIPDPIDRLQGALRSPHGIPIQLTLTGNPGGAGQSWLRERYHLHPLPQHPVRRTRTLPDGMQYECGVIPSRIGDNKLLLQRDPGYPDRLKLVGNEKLVQAWLNGDWSAIGGAFFDEWSEHDHVVEPFPIPHDWIRIVGFDWGSAKPFSVGWWAIPLDDYGDIPRGALVRYREWYGASKPNVGLKLTADQVADGIRERTGAERIDHYVADPSIFTQDGGPSIAERMKLPWTPADNRRVGTLGAVGGWDQVRARLRDRMLFVFSTCDDFVRTIPILQHDERWAEDLDSDSEDHIADEVRYVCMSRIYTGKIDHSYRKGEPQDIPSTRLTPRRTRQDKNWNRARR